MQYLIDSDYVIYHLNEVASARQLLTRLAQDGIAISMVTYAEIYQGVLRAPDRAEAEAKLRNFLAGVPVLPFSFDVAERLGALRETLKHQGKRTRPRALDLVNAATALTHGLTLVTGNVSDYDDIPGLRLYQPN
jgi:tRNA(fMet)-specific endonuclease VapC